MQNQGMQQKRKGLRLADILVTVVIAVVFAVVYKLWGPLYYAVKPLGFQAEQFIYGMWFIAAMVAFLIIRKPGVAFIAEMAAASGEFITGSEWGLSVLVAGALQGLFAEIIFALFKYKKYTLAVTCLAAIGSTAGSLIMDLYYGYIEDLAVWNFSLLIAARTIGAIVISGFFAYYLVKALEATGVANLVRPASEEDYKALEG